jgi:hypothetical protein
VSPARPAVILGLAYMMMAGAPTRYLGVNIGALAIGLTMLALLGRVASVAPRWIGGATVAMAGALLGTAFVGTEVEGISRWVIVGLPFNLASSCCRSWSSPSPNGQRDDDRGHGRCRCRDSPATRPGDGRRARFAWGHAR